ncbi:hypothetical protein FisN_19Hh260 [Fistulifera solaris]|uniref:Uncharacterized protein n=1 Tax=Fistulifera solaris TaxID=1519565 RepID=A0A1Z5K059_FISSO|nr:hypothetical protein FisN_19Hh260 [Fistulifera solaris]|eukprot:GAX19674.1 hypothetical protein FisN_19Hh260 [Fistulifera solaris]
MKISVLFLFVVLSPATAFLSPRASPRVSVAQFAYSGTNSRVNVATSTNNPPPTVAKRPEARRAKELWESTVPVIIHGSSLRTWSFANPNVARVQILLRTEGRPMHANIDLWHGPDNTPQKVALYIEDGALRPFHAYVETPRSPNAVAVYNTGQLEFPLAAVVEADILTEPLPNLVIGNSPRVIQGGALHTYPFDPTVQSVAVLLKTDGRPLNARIELLQGPNNNKQVMEVYSEDGLERPFYVVLETPGSGNVIRIVNTATMEFPLTAYLEPVVVDSTYPPGRFW